MKLCPSFGSLIKVEEEISQPRVSSVIPAPISTRPGHAYSQFIIGCIVAASITAPITIAAYFIIIAYFDLIVKYVGRNIGQITDRTQQHLRNLHNTVLSANDPANYILPHADH